MRAASNPRTEPTRSCCWRSAAPASPAKPETPEMPRSRVRARRTGGTLATAGRTLERRQQRELRNLTIHQQELEAQKQQLIETQRMLEASRDRYGELYEMAPVAYLTL